MKSFPTWLAVVLAGTAFSIGEAAGQETDGGGSARGEVSQVASPAVFSPLLDAPVDRLQYRLGPGDVVGIAVFGETSMLHTLTVTPEGTLVIPRVGVASVLSMNLEQAEQRVRSLVYRYYRNVDVTLSLAGLRSFKVFVLGDVLMPGVRPASSVTRVSEIVGIGDARSCPTPLPRPDTLGAGATRAGGATLSMQRIPEPGMRDENAPCPVSRTTGEPVRMRRNVLLRRADGDTVAVDLARFALLGDLESNPTLREGDALLVPPVEETVSVRGRVAFPGTFEYRRGETLADLLLIVNGGRGFPASAGDTVRVSRFSPGGAREIHALSASDALGGPGRAFPLRAYDAVHVPEHVDYGVQYMVTVRGQVALPGSYPIRPDTTTVRELVAMAGGFTDRASLVSATLQRRRVEGLRTSRDEAIPDSALSPTEQRISRIVSQSGQTYVVIDFTRLFAEDSAAFDQPLQAGDVLTVPERRNDVEVLGAVVRPGLLAYVPGRSVAEYVGLAGGYSQRADRGNATVLRPATGAQLAAGEVRELEPGDQLVIPYREHRTVLERIQMTQTVIGIVSSAALTILGVRSLIRGSGQ